ncbi:hypothetical protein NC653_032293 [Populus alba x Populus x berolinensis]|uniref:Uncharacterized protein n=1 Tax=Populus alba x Populus x berolinensis TaxID=444605 RepID=A0AAD6LR93_9ROSI|nr:hypothetical protein NC653_032293 [Populus alba x Populus x berolinensis]
MNSHQEINECLGIERDHRIRFVPIHSAALNSIKFPTYPEENSTWTAFQCPRPIPKAAPCNAFVLGSPSVKLNPLPLESAERITALPFHLVNHPPGMASSSSFLLILPSLSASNFLNHRLKSSMFMTRFPSTEKQQVLIAILAITSVFLGLHTLFVGWRRSLKEDFNFNPFIYDGITILILAIMPDKGLTGGIYVGKAYFVKER